ncbi:MAG: hypothetical protein JXA71_05755, partial [Chitinispirillaceae bacterium]|nr:hypothetical protein [Chitinispirillaceae bacterium]
YAHLFDTITVRLEYNDLPVITEIAPDWDSTRPFTVNGLPKRTAYTPYHFPPHASVRITFSEPIDSASAMRGIVVYSVFDSTAGGSVVPVRTRQIWNADYTQLKLFAHYAAQSPYFLVTPSRGLFIPTDSLALVVSTDLRDLASTPSGPNRLDINRDFVRDTIGDTAVHLRVDSVTFCVLAVSPADGDSTVSRTPFIELTFSKPVMDSSVDTALTGNRTLILRSRYNSDGQLPYDSVIVDGNNVRFFPGIRFFYRDSVSCYYRGNTVRDRSGFPVDNTGDGIPGTLFDSLTTIEDLPWHFRIKNIQVVSVTPQSGDTVTTTGRSLVLTFSDPVSIDVFDTSLTGNRSFQLRSLYSGTNQSTFRSIGFSADSTVVTLIPVYGYFSNDSLQCLFFGFADEYRYGERVYPGGPENGFSGFAWYFRTGASGFYTYPNPYKPGKDPRHCHARGPCGIWFKNIHTLTTGMLDFRIGIYSVKGYPLYDTRKASGLLHFDPGTEPQWLWDTRNLRGELVASGLYFYVIYDALDRVLVKGKLMIVR